MTKIVLIPALLFAAVAAPAIAAEKTRFTYDDVTYVYTTTRVGNSTVIRGHATPGDAFQFTVTKGQVYGTANKAPVRFSVADAMASRPTVKMENEVVAYRD